MDKNKNPLKAKAVLEFAFDELPDTLYGLKKGKRVTPRLLACLPKNYTQDALFPVLVYIAGGDGGIINRENLNYVRKLTADKDFIAVALPLFKKALDPEEMFKGVLIGAYDDLLIISKCYRKMLKTLFDAVFNIDAKRSLFGGFSNGAHTTAMLVSAVDPFIMKHFSGFYLLDGGCYITSGHKIVVRKKRFIQFVGGSRRYKWRRHLLDFVDANHAMGWQPDVTIVKMPGVEHAFPDEYIPQLRKWFNE
ncbi:MAG: hypothetical protein ABIK92_12975 [Pseudomonadota bacterium]